MILAVVVEIVVVGLVDGITMVLFIEAKRIIRLKLVEGFNYFSHCWDFIIDFITGFITDFIDLKFEFMVMVVVIGLALIYGYFSVLYDYSVVY